ncbi:hypothetical protein ADEAN_000062900 [Angomonas deanei]|uniref:Uncharacterized protein n=1 Tax=Angomonas deanei TaxID=59799 RepID=A0A7G2C383_9TRYP|nr:hypothetical protein ADEAN_000062900 [Angomonas deanei]
MLRLQRVFAVSAPALCAKHFSTSPIQHAPFNSSNEFMQYEPFRDALKENAQIGRVSPSVERRIFRLWMLMGAQPGVPRAKRIETATRLLLKQNKIIRKHSLKRGTLEVASAPPSRATRQRKQSTEAKVVEPVLSVVAPVAPSEATPVVRRRRRRSPARATRRSPARRRPAAKRRPATRKRAAPKRRTKRSTNTKRKRVVQRVRRAPAKRTPTKVKRTRKVKKTTARSTKPKVVKKRMVKKTTSRRKK